MQAALEALNHPFSKTDISTHLFLTPLTFLLRDSGIAARFYIDKYVKAMGKFNYRSGKTLKRLRKFFPVIIMFTRQSIVAD